MQRSSDEDFGTPGAPSALSHACARACTAAMQSLQRDGLCHGQAVIATACALLYDVAEQVEGQPRNQLVHDVLRCVMHALNGAFKAHDAKPVRRTPSA